MEKVCQNAPKVGSSGAFSRTSSRTPHCHLPQFLSHCLLSHLKYLAQHLISSLAYPAKHPDPYQVLQELEKEERARSPILCFPTQLHLAKTEATQSYSLNLGVEWH